MDIFNFMLHVGAAAPVTAKRISVMPDIDPERLNIEYLFELPKSTELWVYGFRIHKDWSDTYIVANFEQAKRDMIEGIKKKSIDEITKKRGEHDAT